MDDITNGTATLEDFPDEKSSTVSQPSHCGVISLSNVDALSELYSPLVKGRNSTFTPAIASGLFPKKRISVTRITTARMAQIGRKWDLSTKT